MDLSVIRSSVRKFERKYRCRLTLHTCFRPFDPTVLPRMHINPFCSAIKREKGHKPCMVFDQLMLMQKLQAEPVRIWKQCAAGLIECVFPILSEKGELDGCLFAGPFRGTLSAKRGNVLSARHVKHVCFKEDPPPVPGRLSDFYTDAELLAFTVSLLLEQKVSTPRNEAEMIREFFRMEHHRDIGLDEVAEMLALTPARASDKLHRLFGKGFCELLREYRIRTACLLLENSTFSITEIAGHSGFRSGSYFHKVFSRCCKMTPQQYRTACHSKHVLPHKN